MWQDLFAAVAIMLVLEGIMPFLSPDGFRKTLRMMDEMDNNTLRWVGLLSMIAGLGLLYIVR